MAMTVLDENGLLYFKQKLDALYATQAALAQKADTSAIPTAVSQLTNDSNYQTESEVTAAIGEAISGVSTLEFQIVDSVEDVTAGGIIYLIPQSGGGGTNNIYDEYIYINSKPEKIGTTEIDLSGYATEAWVTGELADYVTSASLSSQLAKYVTTSSLNSTLGNYVTKTSLTSTLAPYAKTADFTAITNGEIDDMFTA